jgi:hypothetical protein
LVSIQAEAVFPFHVDADALPFHATPETDLGLAHEGRVVAPSSLSSWLIRIAHSQPFYSLASVRLGAAACRSAGFTLTALN